MALRRVRSVSYTHLDVYKRQSYTFNGCFTLRAASGKGAARLVSEQCGTVLSAIQTTLGEESEVDWHFRCE